jgi:hypothetical protein
MSRSRNIKPGYFQNEDLAECDPLARILFAGLWCEADRAGRMEDRPKRLKAAILPYDDCDIDRLLEQLRARGFIVRYEVDGKRYIQIVEFAKHQTPHMKEAASTIPAPCLSGASPVLEPGKNDSSPSDSSFLIPDSSDSTQGESSRSGEDPPPHERAGDPPPESPSAAGLACRAMRKAGITHSNPSHPELHAAIAAGATPEEFGDAAAEAVARGKPNFAYVVKTVMGRRRDAAAAAHHHGTANASQAPPPRFQSKTARGLLALQEMIDGYPDEDSEVVRDDDPAGPAAAAVDVARRASAGGDAPGDGSSVDRRDLARARVVTG